MLVSRKNHLLQRFFFFSCKEKSNSGLVSKLLLYSKSHSPETSGEPKKMQLILSSSVERTTFFSLFLKSLNFLSPTESKRVFTGGRRGGGGDNGADQEKNCRDLLKSQFL